MDKKDIAIERDKRNVCIICESKRTPRSLGLCPMHYQQYRRARASILTEEEREKFDEGLIESGFLLENRQGLRASSVNIFAEFAKNAETAKRLADEMIQEVDATIKEEKERRSKRVEKSSKTREKDATR